MITQLSAEVRASESPLKRAPAGQSPSRARPRERRARTNLRSPAELCETRRRRRDPSSIENPECSALSVWPLSQ
ncbi:hypothetical protein AMECASPLE_009197 [Ameca splendens]|uniref:Uncharacterized protein n=1 Tax=Ameca splendens TaxID=208324 RepID=A0ABV0Y038_9TELE